MINLYKTPYNDTRYRIRIPAENTNLISGLERYLSDVEGYFRTTTGIVNNENILVQLVRSAGVGKDTDNIDISNIVDAILPGLVTTLGLSDERNINFIKGKKTSILKATEVLYITNTFSIADASKVDVYNYHLCRPLRMLNHPMRDLYMNHPSNIVMEDELVTYSIDVFQLLVMYKMYLQDMDGRASGIEMFIHMYVQTNTIEDIGNISILNNYLNKGSAYCKNRHNIGATHIRTYEKMLTKVIDKSAIYDEGIFIIELLRNIKLMRDVDGYNQLCLIPDMYETRHSRVLIVLTLIDYIAHTIPLLDIDQSSNTGYMSKLLYYIKVMINANPQLSSKIATDGYAEILTRVKESSK